jgi:hypothetical protein
MFKSIKTGVLAAILISTAIYAHAQKKIAEGTVTYEMKYSPVAGQEGIVAMLPQETKSKFNSAIAQFQMQQGPAQLTFIMNFLSEDGLFLLDVPVAQWQYAVKLKKEDSDKQKAANPKLSDFKATGETKKIGDYNAEKYTYKDDKGGSYELWATNDVQLPDGFFGTEFKDVKGMLLVYTNFMNGVKTVTTFKKLVDEKVGTLTTEVPKGYTVKTMEEIMALSSGGGE